VTAITSFLTLLWHPESVLPIYGKDSGGCLFTLGSGMLAAPLVVQAQKTSVVLQLLSEKSRATGNPKITLLALRDRRVPAVNVQKTASDSR
jgi:hypothetical protein